MDGAAVDPRSPGEEGGLSPCWPQRDLSGASRSLLDLLPGSGHRCFSEMSIPAPRDCKGVQGVLDWVLDLTQSSRPH